MSKEPLLINKRFALNASTHLLTDTWLKTEVRLEPRIVEVLYHLLKSPGQTVTREELVTTVWQDYGGGDEGLTQAISGLRRHLCDEKKEIIQTIPKKGYVFRGEVEPLTAEPAPLPSPTNKMKWRVAAALGFVLLIAGAIYMWKPAEPKTSFSTGTVLPPGEGERGEENANNTIVAAGKDGAIYKLVMIADRRPKFYINDSLIPVDQWEPHQDLINSLTRQLQEKRSSK